MTRQDISAPILRVTKSLNDVKGKNICEKNNKFENIQKIIIILIDRIEWKRACLKLWFVTDKISTSECLLCIMVCLIFTTSESRLQRYEVPKFPRLAGDGFTGWDYGWIQTLLALKPRFFTGASLLPDPTSDVSSVHRIWSRISGAEAFHYEQHLTHPKKLLQNTVTQMQPQGGSISLGRAKVSAFWKNFPRGPTIHLLKTPTLKASLVEHKWQPWVFSNPGLGHRYT